MEKLASFFTSLSLILTYIFGFGTISTSDGYELVRKEKLNSAVSICSAQGLCCDGEYFYASGALSAVNITGLAKYDLEMNCKKIKFNAVPKEFAQKYGSNHIGGIDCANGYIYASVEGKIDGEYKYNFILLYDCDTLEYTGKYYELTSEHLTDGLPWCAVDAEGGFLYTSKYNGANEILQYSLEDMSLVKCIPLQQVINRIQGGSYYNGTLYLSYDVAHSTNEQILAVNPDDGSVSVEMIRYLPNYDNEAEDICFYPLEDGTLIHTLDYDKLLNVNIMHYKVSVK